MFADLRASRHHLVIMDGKFDDDGDDDSDYDDDYEHEHGYEHWIGKQTVCTGWRVGLMRGVLRLLMIGFLPVLCAAAADVAIAPDRMLLVNGQRTFIIGLYENPTDDAVLDDVAASGFNLVQCSSDVTAIDRLWQRGIYAWVNIGGRTELEEEDAAGIQALKDLVATCGPHPGFLVWEISDESLWGCYLNAYRNQKTLVEMANAYHASAAAQAARMARGYQAMKEIDPRHPIWENYAAGNSHEQVAAHAQGADIIGADIYPLMPYPTSPVDVSRRGLGYVGVTTTKMQNAAPEKPVWMVLQGMSWGDTNDLFTHKPEPAQYPTYEESRFMAYDAIVRGARGVLYWGTYLVPKDAQIWKDILRIARELAGNQPLLSAPDSPVVPAIETRIFGFVLWDIKGSPIGVRALGKVVGGQTWWIVANELFLDFTYTLRGLDGLEGVAYVETTTGQTATVSGGALSFPIPKYGVHVLKPAAPEASETR